MIVWIVIHLLLTYWIYERIFFRTGRIFFSFIAILGSVIILSLQIGFIIILLFHSILIIIFRKRDEKELLYENSSAIFEGGGIMRGLTSVEASILLGAPYYEVLLILFTEMAIKKIVQYEKLSPLQLIITSRIALKNDGEITISRGEYRRKMAQENNILLYPYEEGFIEYVEQNQGIDFDLLDFSFLIEPLVERVAERVSGFNIDETIDYYHQIINRVVVEISAGDFLFLSNDKSVMRNIGWLMLDETLKKNIVGIDGKLIPTLNQYTHIVPFDLIEAFYNVFSQQKNKYSINLKLGKNINVSTAQFLADTNRATFTS